MGGERAKKMPLPSGIRRQAAQHFLTVAAINRAFPTPNAGLLFPTADLPLQSIHRTCADRYTVLRIDVP